MPGRRHQAANCQKRGRRCVAVFQAALRQAKRLSVNQRYTVSGIMPNVRFGSKADMTQAWRDVRYCTESRHQTAIAESARGKGENGAATTWNRETNASRL